MTKSPWVGLYLDVEMAWWESGEGSDLFVQFSGAESMPDGGRSMPWAVFARPGADGTGESAPSNYARFVSGHTERDLVTMAERHGYTRCRIGTLRFFAGWQSVVSEEPAAPMETMEPEETESSTCSPVFVVGDAPHHLLVQILRNGAGLDAWRWSEHEDLPDVLRIDDDAVSTIFGGTGVLLTVTSAGDEDTLWEGLPEDTERDLLDDFPWPEIEWFGSSVPRRPRPHLTTPEEIALGERVVQAVPVFTLAENGVEAAGQLTDCTSEDLAELTWGLANGRIQVYRDWSEIEPPAGWQVHESTWRRWRTYGEATPVRPPWNALLRYDPPAEESGLALYFLARLGFPADVEDLRVGADELPAFMLCLAIGTLEGIRSGAMPVEGGALALGPGPLLWWLEDRLPGAVHARLIEVAEALDMAVGTRLEGGAERKVDVRDMLGEGTMDGLIDGLCTALANLPVPAWHVSPCRRDGQGDA